MDRERSTVKQSPGVECPERSKSFVPGIDWGAKGEGARTATVAHKSDAPMSFRDLSANRRRVRKVGTVNGGMTSHPQEMDVLV